MLNYKQFLNVLIIEDLHPELRDVVNSTHNYRSKQSLIAKKIKDLTTKGEKTGIEGNMPEGSSRAYLKHEEPHNIILDHKPTHIRIGTKVAIKSRLDPYHDKSEHDNMSLGALQNHAEGGDHFINSHYRILTKGDKPNEYETNTESGIFPPLIDHDQEHHEWTQIGHARDIKGGEFRQFTKTKEFPKGISHKDFYQALNRFHNNNNGKYWRQSPEKENRLDHISKHPLVQKFINYHGDTGNPTYDYQQKKNLGIFEHSNGSKHIVARDHGFNVDVAKAYRDANHNLIHHPKNRF